MEGERKDASVAGLRERDSLRRPESHPSPAGLEDPIVMAHQIAKLILEHAGTAVERTDAVQAAIQLGMPLREIEEYLDWLENVRPNRKRAPDNGRHDAGH